MSKLRAQLYRQLDPAAWPHKGLSPLNRIVITAILVSVATAVIESEPTIYHGHETIFHVVEIALGVLFAIEYLARVWTSAENPRYRDGLRGRLRYLRSPAAVLDLLALAPLLVITLGAEPFLLRLFRLIRVLRLARLGRFSRAIGAMGKAVRSHRYELMTSMCLAGMLLLITSTLMYLVEGGAQPEAFGSIPRAMWWSIATLTTVGYGDMVPLTPLGRLLGGITALTAIGLIAMPTGILAAAFGEAMREREATEAAARDDAQRRAGGQPGPNT